jgi:4-hydroxybenzoyl-CoA thioesterase
MATFSRNIPVHFSDTDPAGILFYQRYFQMTSALVEDWFAEELGYPFNAMHKTKNFGVPTIRLDISFSAASRIADLLRFTLGVVQRGKSSFTLDITATCSDEERLNMRQVMVYAALGAKVKPAALPDDLRARMESFLASEPAKDS